MTEMEKTVQQKKTDLVTGVNFLFGLGFLVCVVFFLLLCLFGGGISLSKSIVDDSLRIHRLFGGEIGIVFSVFVLIYYLSLKDIKPVQKKSFIFTFVLFLVYSFTGIFRIDGAEDSQIVAVLEESYIQGQPVGMYAFFVWLVFCLFYCLYSTFRRRSK